VRWRLSHPTERCTHPLSEPPAASSRPLHPVVGSLSARASEPVSTAPPCACALGLAFSRSGCGGWGTLDCRHSSFGGHVLNFTARSARAVYPSFRELQPPSRPCPPTAHPAHAVSSPRLAHIAHCSVSSSAPYPCAPLNGYPPRLHVRGQACVLQVRHGGWGTLDCRHGSVCGRVLCAFRAGPCSCMPIGSQPPSHPWPSMALSPSHMSPMK
jgi:hypothetical protein